jgi:DNA transformation protein
MAVSESFLTFVLEQLDGVKHVSSRRMFGGVGLYSGEHFFGLLDNDRLYFKADDATVVDYTREGMGPFRPGPSQAVSMKYYEVPVSVLEDRDVLAVWAGKAVAVSGARTRAMPPRKRRKTPSRRRSAPARKRRATKAPRRRRR